MNREILLIEDDTNYRQSIRFLFEGEPYQFVEAASPDQGIAALKDNPLLRVILLDLHFNDGKATAVLDHLKNRPTDYRVIVLTGHDELLRAELADEYEVFHYLPKAEISSTQAIRFSVEQAFKDLERTDLARKVDFLLQVQKKVNANLNTEETLDDICEFVRSIVGAYTCHIRVYDIKHGDYRLGGFAGTEKGIRHLFERPRTKGELFSGKVVESREVAVYPDLQNMEEFLRFKASALERPEVSVQEKNYWRKVRSAYIVPISTVPFGDFVDAVLNVSSESVDFFSEEKRALVDEYQTLAGLTITKDWLHRKGEDIHQDYSEISGMLAEITDRLKGRDVTKGIYEVVTRKIAKIINAEVVTIFLYNETTGLVESVAELRGNTLLAEPTEDYEPSESLTGWIYANDEAIHLPRQKNEVVVKPLDDERFGREKQEVYLRAVPSNRIEHYLGVPIRMGGKIRGVLRAINKKSAYYDEAGRESPHCLLERGFSRDCRNAMEITASHLAVAVRNAELLREKDSQVVQIRLISEVGSLINSTLDIDEVLRRTIAKMAEVIHAEICMLFLVDGDSKILLKQCFGMPMIPNANYKLGEGVTGKVAETGSPWLQVTTDGNDGKYDKIIVAHLAKVHGVPKHIESLMVVPILAKNKPLGAMKVINKTGDQLQFGHNDLELFQMFAGYVGVALENAQIYKVASDRLAIAERNAALSSLVSAVAHEINNTSGLIPANVDGIRDELGAPSESIGRMLNLIEDAANQATEFANEIAGFSANRTGERQVVDINEIIRGTIRELAAVPKYRNLVTMLKIELSAKSLICDIYMNPFKQIVRNVIINAFQALENTPKGRILVSTAEGNGELEDVAVIEIEDNGPGIKPENKKKIFDPLFTTKPKGNGVGLWLVRTQLQLVGGEITVESEVDHGAKFAIIVPLFHNGETGNA